MNIDWIVPCRYVEVHDNLGTIVGAGIDTWWLPELPQVVQVPIAIRLLAAPGELEAATAHPVSNIIFSPDGAEVSNVSEDVAIGGEGRPDWLTGLIVATVIQLEITAPGTWHFEHRIDDSTFRVPMHVVQDFPPGHPNHSG